MMRPEHGKKALQLADKKVMQLLDAAASISDGDVAVVDAPAGAGKTGLVTRLVARHLKNQRTLAVVTQTNEQADDLTKRLADEQPKLTIERFISTQHTPPAFPGNVTVLSDANSLGGGHVAIATADKWAFAAEKLGSDRFEIGLVDEAYQMGGAKLLYIADLFDALQLVGDPGQLSPFSQADTSRWSSLITDPTKNAVDTIRSYREVDSDALPVTRRLPAVAADIIREAFYPTLDFAAATELGARRLTADTRTRAGSADRAVDMALAEGWALVELPNKAVLRNDQELAFAAASIAKAFLARNTRRLVDEHTGLDKVLAADRIAIGASHRDQVAALRAELERQKIKGVVVDTANRLQGREFDLVIGWHPLSGQVEASSFHLDVGRMCVLTTRHRHACVMLTRSGTRDLLDMNVPVGEGLLGETNDRSISGWEAHMLMLDALEKWSVAW